MATVIMNAVALGVSERAYEAFTDQQGNRVEGGTSTTLHVWDPYTSTADEVKVPSILASEVKALAVFGSELALKVGVYSQGRRTTYRLTEVPQALKRAS